MNTPQQYKQTLKPENYLELWKYFSDDAAKIKDRMWTIASLFFAVITTLTGFIAGSFSNLGKENILQGKELIQVVIVSISLVGLCAYFKFIMQQYGKHLRNGWNRTNFIRMQIEGLSEIWYLGNETEIKSDYEGCVDTSLPKEVKRLIDISNYIIAGYGLFVVLGFTVILSR